MSDTKMLQTLIDGQARLEKKVDAVDKKVEKVDQRLDKLGMQLAYLEDDTPTRKEHNKLERRVRRLEQRFTS